MKKVFITLFTVTMVWNSVSAQNPIYDSARVYDIVTDTDLFYLFANPKPCFNPCPYSWAPVSRMVQEYVVTDTVTVYGVAVPLRNKTSNPIRDSISFYRALLMRKTGYMGTQGYSFQYVDSVTLNRSHPRFCWFYYEDPCDKERNLTAPCYEFYFDTPQQINRMMDTFYVGRYYQVPYVGYPDYSLQEYGGEYDPSLPSTIYRSPIDMEIFYYCEGYQDKRWGVAFPIIGFRCGPIQQLFLDAYTGDSAVVRWRQVEEGTLYNVRLTGEDGSDTAFVISDTTYTFTPLSDSVRYTAMVRKQCHYATSNYDTTVYGEWKTVSFGTTIIDTTIADTTGVDTVGIARPEVEGFSLVPNPTNGAVLLTTEAEMTGVEVYTAAGVPFLHLPASGRTVRFDTSTWPAGTYLLTVSTSQGIITRRLTVIR